MIVGNRKGPTIVYIKLFLKVMLMHQNLYIKSVNFLNLYWYFTDMNPLILLSYIN